MDEIGRENHEGEELKEFGPPVLESGLTEFRPEIAPLESLPVLLRLTFHLSQLREKVGVSVFFRTGSRSDATEQAAEVRRRRSFPWSTSPHLQELELAKQQCRSD